MKIEIDLGALHKAEGKSSGRPGLVKRKVKVHRGGKVFEQYRWVKSGADEPAEKKPSVEEPAPKPKKELAIMGLNKPEPEPEPKVEEKPEPEKKPKPEKKLEKIDTKDLSTRMGFYESGLKFHPDGEKMIESVEEYTIMDYSTLNDYLRGGLSDDDEYEDKINNISSFLKNAPKMEGKVYRGMGFSESDFSDPMASFTKFLDDAKEGSMITLKSFTSTSTNKDIATDFLFDDYQYTIEFEIESKLGVYLNGVSQKKEEDEVLFDKNSKFNITKVDKSGYPDHVRIIMKEV